MYYPNFNSVLRLTEFLCLRYHYGYTLLIMDMFFNNQLIGSCIPYYGYLSLPFIGKVKIVRRILCFDMNDYNQHIVLTVKTKYWFSNNNFIKVYKF